MKEIGSLLLMVVIATVADDTVSKNLVMVGNSYTAYHGLSGKIRSMLLEAYESVGSYQYAPGGKLLTSHLADALGENGQDNQLRSLLVTNPPSSAWVTIQEQSQVAGFVDYSSLFGPSLQAAVELDGLVQQSGGETIFFMTWGRRDGDKNNLWLWPDFLTMNADLTEGYRRYAEATNDAKVAPVGLAFEYIYRDLVDQGVDPLQPGSEFHSLYNSDGSHPSSQGSYLAACVMYSTMTGRDPRDLLYLGGLDVQLADRLQSVAFETIQAEQEGFPTPQPTDSPVTAPPTPAPTDSPVAALPTAAPTAEVPCVDDAASRILTCGAGKCWIA